MTYPIRNFPYALMYNVVDGDTCDIEVDLGFSVKMRHRFRLARINTPEVGKPGYDLAKSFLKIYLNRPAIIEVTKLDKYGRYLVELYVDGININDLLLANGLAVLYV